MISRRLKIAVLSLLPRSFAVRLQYLAHHKRWPNLSKPQRLTEKIARRKLVDRNQRMVLFADKARVKPEVARIIGADRVTPTIWQGPQLPPRAERNWPLPFVIKTNNGSGTNIFVRTEADLDWDVIETRVAPWVGQSHGGWAGEWLYGQIDQLILVEPYIGSGDVLPFDYKLFVFDGKVHFLQLDTDRATEHKRNLYDRDWQRLPISMCYPPDERDFERPASLTAMIADAGKIGAEFPFVRIDFYEIDGKPVFGEATFYPDSGCGVIEPDHYDRDFGSLWPD